MVIPRFLMEQNSRARSRRWCSEHLAEDVRLGKRLRALNEDAPRGLLDEKTDFEKAESNGFESCPAKGGQLSSKRGVGLLLGRQLLERSLNLPHQAICGHIQEESKGVGDKVCATEFVAGEVVFQLIDSKFTIGPHAIGFIENPSRKSSEIGDQKSRIVFVPRTLSLAGDHSLMRPATGLIVEGGELSQRSVAARIMFANGLGERAQFGLESRIFRDTEEVIDPAVEVIEEFQTIIKSGAGKACVCANADSTIRAEHFDEHDELLQYFVGVSRVAHIARSKHGGDELTGLSVDDHQGMKDVSVVKAVVEEFLLFSKAFYGTAVEIEDQALDVFGESANEVRHQRKVHDLHGLFIHGIFKPGQRRLRRKPFFALWCQPHDRLPQRTLSQPVGIVAVLISHTNLKDSLLHLLNSMVSDTPCVTPIGDKSGEHLADTNRVLGLPQKEQSSVARDVGRRELDIDWKFRVEIKAGFRVTLCHERRGCWRCEIRELHQQFTRVSLSRKGSGGELFRLESR